MPMNPRANKTISFNWKNKKGIIPIALWADSRLWFNCKWHATTVGNGVDEDVMILIAVSAVDADVIVVDK